MDDFSLHSVRLARTLIITNNEKERKRQKITGWRPKKDGKSRFCVVIIIRRVHSVFSSSHATQSRIMAKIAQSGEIRRADNPNTNGA